MRGIEGLLSAAGAQERHCLQLRGPCRGAPSVGLRIRANTPKFLINVRRSRVLVLETITSFYKLLISQDMQESCFIFLFDCVDTLSAKSTDA